MSPAHHAWAQIPHLVADLTTGNQASDPSGPVACGNHFYFTADDGIHGRELWKSDGTERGTVMVKDLCEGKCGSMPGNLCAVNGVLFFTAYESDKGTELWRSDGTPEGTYRVRDINIGSSNFSPRFFTGVGSVLYFTASDGRKGAELWKSDGTEKGTVMVKDIAPGPVGSLPEMLTAAGGRLYFRCRPDKNGASELWSSDGTENGTQRSGNTGNITALRSDPVNAAVYYTAENPAAAAGSRHELWCSPGADATAVKLHASAIRQLLSLPSGKDMYFTEGNTLWKTGGDPASTGKIKSHQTDARKDWKLKDDPFTFGSYCVFLEQTGSDASPQYETRIYDGRTGTVRVLEKQAVKPVFVNGILYYFRITGETMQLWQCDPASGKTKPAGEAKFISRTMGKESFCLFQGRLIFNADDGVNGTEPLMLDISSGKLSMLKNVNTRGISSSPFNLTPAGKTLYFMTGQGEDELHLWRTDGKASGTEKVWSGRSGYETPGTESVCHAGGKLFLMLRRPGNSPKEIICELWVYDGKAGAAVMLRSYTTGGSFQGEDQMAAFRDKLYFTAEESGTGTEVWSSDGTAEGTRILKDILRGREGSRPQWYTPCGNYLYFTADNYNEGNELWRTDGTAAGTVMVKDIWDGGNSSDPVFLRAAGEKLYFSADDGTHGHELWCTDGTAANTYLVADIRPGSDGSAPEEMNAAGSVVYFAANNGKQGVELWRSDGTEAGTYMVRDIFPGAEDSGPGDLTVLNGILFFTANDGRNGVELWKSEGSEKKTEMVKDIQKGRTGSGCRNFVGAAGILFFVAMDGENNPELWKSNGSSGGTEVIAAPYSSDNTLPPMFLCATGDRLWFIVDKHDSGTELWCMELGRRH